MFASRYIHVKPSHPFAGQALVTPGCAKCSPDSVSRGETCARAFRIGDRHSVRLLGRKVLCRSTGVRYSGCGGAEHGEHHRDRSFPQDAS